MRVDRAGEVQALHCYEAVASVRTFSPVENSDQMIVRVTDEFELSVDSSELLAFTNSFDKLGIEYFNCSYIAAAFCLEYDSGCAIVNQRPYGPAANMLSDQLPLETCSSYFVHRHFPPL